MSFVLLIGGARSGKSRLAVELASRASESVAFIATAEARDEEMTARIAQHRRERPANWTTVEEPLDLESVVRRVDPGSAAIVDCLTLWVSNLLEREVDDDAIVALASTAARNTAQHTATFVVVTNEVGSGVVPPSPLGRRFADVLGRVNAVWAAAAERAYLVVAGRVLPLEALDG